MRKEFLFFEIEGRLFGIAIETVREVLRCAALTPPVGDEQRIEGFLNLRGTTLPVANLRAAFGLPAKVLAASESLIVVDYEGRLLAIRADTTPRIEQAAVPDHAVETSHELAPGCVHWGERVALIIDPAAMVRFVRYTVSPATDVHGVHE